MSWESCTPANSDTLRIQLPEDPKSKNSHSALKLLAARNLVESFGAIAHLEKCDGDDNAVAVTYFDLRAASCARQTFGECSAWLPARGRHQLRFRQEELQAAVMNDIFDVSANEDLTFTIRFFDSRTASQCEAVRAMCFGTPPLENVEPTSSVAQEKNDDTKEVAKEWRLSVSQVPTADTLAELSGGEVSSDKDLSSASSDDGSTQVADADAVADPLQSTIIQLLQEPVFLEPPSPISEDLQKKAPVKPKYINDLRQTQLSWDDLASKKEKRTTLRLRCLSQRMCIPGALEAFLEANQLSGLVEKVRIVSSASQGGGAGKRNVGVALLKAKHVDDVPRLAKFFHGRQLGGSTPVSVSFAAERGCGLIPSQAKATRDEPCYIPAPLQVGKIPSEAPLDHLPPGLERFCSHPPGLTF